METIYNIKELQEVLVNEKMAIIYFSNDACNVCKILKPKIKDLVLSDFPKCKLIYIDTEKSPVIAGQYRVFTIPTIDIYIEGKEHARFSRNVAMHEFVDAIEKPYQILFEEN